MRIYPDQMDALDALARAQFHERLLEVLRSDFEGLAQLEDTEAALRWIADRHARAAVHRIAMEHDVTTYVMLCLLCGDDFDEHPEMAPVFDPPGGDIGDRLQALLEGIARELKEMAEQPGGG